MSLKKADADELYPNAAKKKVGEKLIGALAVGDLVNVKLKQKVVKAEVLELVSQMHSAYLSFEDYPSIYDEWQPTDLLRTPDRAEISPTDLKPGLMVIDLSNKNVSFVLSERLEASVYSCRYSNIFLHLCLLGYFRSTELRFCLLSRVQWQGCVCI
jgi:hypothetical protein